MNFNNYRAGKDMADTFLMKDIQKGKTVKNYKKTTVTLVAGENEFSGLADSWRELADQAGVSVFSSFDWLHCWWKHFGRHPKRQLFIVTIYSGEMLIGIAPFYIGRSSAGPITIQRRLYLMGCGTDRNEFFGFINDYGYSDFLDVIAHPRYKNTVAAVLAGVIKHNPGKADVICFQHVKDDSFVRCVLLPCLDKLNIRYNLETSDHCPYLTLPDTLEEYIEQTGPSSRRRRLRKNLEKAGSDYFLKTASSARQVEKGVGLLVSLHQKRWNSLGFPGTFFDDRHLDFVKEMSRILYQKGQLWVTFAIDQKGYSAVRLAINDGKSFYDWLSGFDDSAPSSKYSPGLGLLAVMIREAIKSRASSIEFMRGKERYKYDFTSESRYNRRVTIPFYAGKSHLHSALHTLLIKASKIYFRLSREWKLLRVQYRRAGWLKMFFCYVSFRWKTFREKRSAQ